MCIVIKKDGEWSRGTIWENRDNIHGIAVSLNWKKKVFLVLLIKNMEIRQKEEDERAAGGR